MKLKRFNKQTTTVRLDGKPFIYFHSSGSISLSPIACEKIGLKDGISVEIVQDEERKKDWYITVSTSKDALQLRPDKQKGKFSFNNVHIAKSILKCLVDEQPPMPKTASLLISIDPVSHEGETLWPIITAGFKRK